MVGSIRIVEGLFRRTRLEWPDASLTPIELASPRVWRRINLDLYQPGVEKRVRAIQGFGEIKEGVATLLRGCAGRTGVLSIMGGSTADRMPWEALQFVDTSLEYHPVRSDPKVVATPADRPGPLRVVLVVGHPGATNAFDRDAELEQLERAFRHSTQVRERVSDADRLPALDLSRIVRAKDRRAMFTSADPHVVIFFGHGRVNPAPQLLAGPGSNDWLSLREFASYADGVQPYPATWVFIACSIGEAPYPGPAGPEAFRILASRGARTMLAMRSRIRPLLARVIAASLVESLSAGIPLELAAATARNTARRARQNDASALLDWAAPAVWSTVVGDLPRRASDAPVALLAAKLTRRAVEDLGIGLGEPDDVDRRTALRWAGERRLRIDLSREDDASAVARLGKVVGALGTVTGRPALLLRARGVGPFTTRLADRAEESLLALDSFEREAALGMAMQRLAQRDLEGLESVLGVPRMIAVFTAPPDDSDEVAWSLLEGASADCTVVVGYDSQNQKARPGWAADRINAEDAVNDARAVLERCRRTLALLSVLEEPVRLTSLSAVTKEPSADVAQAGLTVPMPSGDVLTAAARQVVRERLRADEIIQAHRDALAARRHVPPLLESNDRFATVRNLAGSDSDELARFVDELAERSGHSWTEADWVRLGAALEPARERWRSLNPQVLLGVAGALVSRQTTKPARLWLRDMETDDPQLDARKESMLSEIAKAEGRERMWKHARQALMRLENAVAQNETPDRRLASSLREVRGNLARLELYFNGDAPGARRVLESIVEELGHEPEAVAAETLVSTLRNLAECLFEFEPYRSTSEDLRQAREHLVRGAAVAGRHHLDALCAETLYSTAKLDEAQKDWAAARDHLQGSVECARRAGHSVCQGIAEMRIHRLGVQRQGEKFDPALFAARLRRLEYLESHAWARRYAAQARLWGAHEFSSRNERAPMHALLLRNLDVFQPVEMLASGAERHLVALSHAGLAVLSASSEHPDQHQGWWERFKALAWAPEWIERQGASDFTALWGRGT